MLNAIVAALVFGRTDRQTLYSGSFLYRFGLNPNSRELVRDRFFYCGFRVSFPCSYALNKLKLFGNLDVCIKNDRYQIDIADNLFLIFVEGYPNFPLDVPSPSH